MRIKHHGALYQQPRQKFKARCFCESCGCAFIAKIKDWTNITKKTYIDGCGITAGTITKYEVTTCCPECDHDVRIYLMNEDLALVAYSMGKPK